MTSPYKRPTAEVGTVTFGKNRSASGDWALDALESIVGAVLRVLVGIPILGLAVVAGSVSWWWSLDHGWQVPAIALGGLLGLAVLLRVAAPALFERCVADPIVSSWRKTVLYERWWQPTMACSGLAYRPGSQQEALPQLKRVRSHRGVDVVRVRMLPGQTVSSFGSVSEGLATSFRAQSCRVRSVPRRPQDVDLRVVRRDPLAAVVAPPEPAESLDLHALHVGRDELCRPATMPVLYASTLLAGEPGAGKSSAIWSYLLAMAPGIRAGLMQVWAIDAKGGMELSMGQPLFRRAAFGEGAEGAAWQADIADLLDEAVQVMQRRQAVLRGVSRKHVPTTAEPLIVVLIDELAAITSYITDNALKKRINAALSLLLSQGRAPGVSVIAATQDPRKEVVQMRDLFTHRIAFRTAEADTGDLILGDGARARGALTAAIPTSTPGVAYLVADGEPEPVRFRFFFMVDADIRRLVERVRRPRLVVSSEEPYRPGDAA